MARTTSAKVIQIMDDCTVSTTIIDSLITSASALLDKVFEDDSEMTDTVLTEIERWFVAHMIASGIQRTYRSEKLGDAEIAYTEPVVYFGVGSKILSTTEYGRTVLILDFTGKLGRLGKTNATVFAIPMFTD